MIYLFSTEIEEENRETILNSKMFQNWLSQVSEKFSIKEIYFSSVDFREKSKEPLFIKLRATAALPDGRPVHGIVLVRGNAVGVLVVLWCEGAPYLLLVRQPRFPIAERDSLEIPAGILDWSGDYRKVALSELQEEAQIQIEDSELIDLTAFWHGPSVEGFAASCGLLDERIRIYAVERNVTREELFQMNHREQSYTEENEWIYTEILPYEEAAKKFIDGKNLIALFMYERYLLTSGRTLATPPKS